MPADNSSKWRTTSRWRTLQPRSAAAAAYARVARDQPRGIERRRAGRGSASDTLPGALIIAAIAAMVWLGWKANID
jgi:ferric-dicitrate binding protein FerR (iron transport regulator)